MDIGTILSIGGSLVNAFGSKHKTRLSEIRSPQESAWINQLNNRSRTGTVPMSELNEVAGRTIAGSGSVMRNRLQGNMLSQGLGNSIVASELMRRTDRETLNSLADESRKIALANEMSKIKAQDMLGEYGVMRSNRLMGIAQANAEYKRAEQAGSGGFGDILSSLGGMLG